MQKDNRIYLSRLGSMRGCLMGVATVMILFTHLPMLVFEKPNIVMDMIRTPKWLYKSAVEIFLILSGMGLYGSMKRCGSTEEFYKRRFLRVIPAVFIVTLLWSLLNNVGLKKTLLNVSLLSFWLTGERLFWYFSLLIILYIVYPLIHKPIESGKLKLPVVLGAVLGMNLLLHIAASPFYDRSSEALCRIPAFVLGVYCGKRLYTGDIEIKRRWVRISALAVVLILAYFFFEKKIAENERLYWTINTGNIMKNYIRTVFACALMVVLISLNIKRGIAGKILEKVGAYSMEVYLVQEKIQILTEERFIKAGILPGTLMYDAVIILLTAAAAIILKKVCDEIVKIIKQREKKIIAK